MNNDMEKKLDELLERLPKTQYDTEAWLTEDLTDEYDRIVRQRRRKTWMWRWSAAAVVALLCTVGIVLQKEAEAPVVAHKVTVVPPPVIPQQPAEKEKPLLAETTQPKASSQKRKALQAAVPQTTVRQMTPIDSLADIVEHIEQAMQGVRDSVYMANVEKLIRTDDRLQHLVNQLILEGIIADPDVNTAAFTDLQYND